MTTFAEAAQRLCGAAAMLLGWRPDEFWCATPAELAMCLTLDAHPTDAPDRDLLEELLKRFPD